MTEALFDLNLPEHPADPTAGMSAQQKMTRRKQQALAQGLHPLAVLFGHIRLHKDAAPADDRNAPGLRCGGCRHFGRNFHGYPHCLYGDGVRSSNSANSECRQWYPACVDYQPRNGSETARA